MARTVLTPKVKRTAVFVKDARDGHAVYVRRPYDIVEFDEGTGTRDAYLQIFPGGGAMADTELYDEVRTYNIPPAWDIETHQDPQ